MRRQVRRLRSRQRALVARSIVRLGGTGVGERILGPIRTVADLLSNDSSDGSVNGEYGLLDRLAASDPHVVIDAGANFGSYATAVAARFPHARVYAFEPVPSTFDALSATVAGAPGIEAIPMALSDRDGHLEMWRDTRSQSAMSSAVAPPHAASQQVSVRCTTGDTFLSERGIDRVDLLKVDKEGLELEVLHGFRAAIEAQRIEAIQFEHTRWAVAARRWLADFHELFEEAGYVVGRVRQRRIDWSPYTIYDEDFLRANFVAVPVGGRAAALLDAPS